MFADILGVLLQTVEIPGAGRFDLTVSLGGGAVGAALTTLLVGAILVALAPEYTERKMQTVREDTVQSFFYGLFALLAVVLLTLALFISVIGILVAVPFALLSVVIWSVGAAIAYLAIAKRLIDSDDWLVPLLVAAAINGGLTLTGIGALLSFCIGATGFGAVVRDYLT